MHHTRSVVSSMSFTILNTLQYTRLQHKLVADLLSDVIDVHQSVVRVMASEHG